MGQYAFDNAAPGERERLAGLETVFDPPTVHYLAAVGVGRGWRCLDVGGGGGSIAAWLCQRVGREGRVVATDLDTRFLEARARTHPQLEVRRHNILTDVLEEETFDLVHARLLLEHLPEAEHALTRMVAALRPGGWLVLEDLDWSAAAPDPAVDSADAQLFLRTQSLWLGIMQRQGFDPAFGRQLPRLLRGHGLVEIAADGRTWVAQGGSPSATWWRLTFETLSEPLRSAGALTTGEVERVRALLADPRFAFLYPVLMLARGRRPAAGATA